jgi:high-affinity Fe2+/Pb2+ permease
MFESRKSRLKHERAINAKAMVVLLTSSALGVLAFAIGAANTMEQRENWTAGALAVTAFVLLAAAVIVERRCHAHSVQSSSK